MGPLDQEAINFSPTCSSSAFIQTFSVFSVADLKFVATAMTGGRVKSLSAV